VQDSCMIQCILHVVLLIALQQFHVYLSYDWDSCMMLVSDAAKLTGTDCI
jgi:hypothetical protein